MPPSLTKIFARREQRLEALGPLAVGLLALFSYLAFRLYLQARLSDSTHELTGLLQYDSYYHLAYAAELSREGHFFFFHNPFGSLDGDARLFNGLASLLMLLDQFWRQHLFFFDLTLGCLSSFGAGGFFAATLNRLSQQTPGINVLLSALVVVGGGIGFLVAAPFNAQAPEFAANILNGGYWGLSWQLNNIALWELLYHLVFWWGAWALLKRRLSSAIGASLLLALVHPFTAVTLAMFGGFVLIEQTITGRTWRAVAPSSVAASLVGFLQALFYQFIWPHYSADAQFMATAYAKAPFHVAWYAIFCFLLPALVVFGCFVWKSKSWNGAPGASASPGSWACLATGVTLLALALSYLYTDLVPQPAHWLRVYPVAFLVIAGAGCRAYPRQYLGRLRLLLGGLLLIALADNILGVAAVGTNLQLGKSAPLFVDKDSAALLAYLGRQLPGQAVYYRSCDNVADFPQLEYAFSALSGQQLAYGHRYFSPQLQARAAQFRICDGDLRLAMAAKANGYVILDHQLCQLPQCKPDLRFGRFDLFRPVVEATVN